MTAKTLLAFAIYSKEAPPADNGRSAAEVEPIVASRASFLGLKWALEVQPDGASRLVQRWSACHAAAQRKHSYYCETLRSESV